MRHHDIHAGAAFRHSSGRRLPAVPCDFDRVAAALHDLRPDLLVHTGDVSLDGAGQEADLAYAAGAHARLPGPVWSVPGNHDVGDYPERAPQRPMDDPRLERFHRHMGRDRWVQDRDGWRLLGLNSQVMGVHPETEALAATITEALDTLGNRRLAVFIHHPYFAADPDETVFDYWSVPPFARAPIRPIRRYAWSRPATCTCTGSSSAAGCASSGRPSSPSSSIPSSNQTCQGTAPAASWCTSSARTP